MQPISDILPSKSTTRSERAELLQFFISNIHDKKGKNYRAAFIAVKMSHLKLKDLFYMKSVFTDLQRCKGQEAAEKWWWFSLRS